jgi:hypothetical protein
VDLPEETKNLVSYLQWICDRKSGANPLDGLVAEVGLPKPNSQGLTIKMGGSVFYLGRVPSAGFFDPEEGIDRFFHF